MHQGLRELTTTAQKTKYKTWGSVDTLSEELALELQSRKQELLVQNNKIASLEQSLWSAQQNLDVQQRSEIPSMKEMLLAATSAEGYAMFSSGLADAARLLTTSEFSAKNGNLLCRPEGDSSPINLMQFKGVTLLTG